MPVKSLGDTAEGCRVRVFAVTSKECMRLPALALLPTLAESGLPDLSVTVRRGLSAPKKTPAPVLAKLNDALRNALKDRELAVVRVYLKLGRDTQWRQGREAVTFAFSCPCHQKPTL